LLADRDEDFNTRIGSMRGWQMALERVKPIPRHVAGLDLAGLVLQAECTTPMQVVEYFIAEFFAVEVTGWRKAELAALLTTALGTSDVASTSTFLEEPLRKLLHQMFSLPEYQLG
jgi:hypothetical protein